MMKNIIVFKILMIFFLSSNLYSKNESSIYTFEEYNQMLKYGVTTKKNDPSDKFRIAAKETASYLMKEYVEDASTINYIVLLHYVSRELKMYMRTNDLQYAKMRIVELESEVVENILRASVLAQVLKSNQSNKEKMNHFENTHYKCMSSFDFPEREDRRNSCSAKMKLSIKLIDTKKENLSIYFEKFAEYDALFSEKIRMILSRIAKLHKSLYAHSDKHNLNLFCASALSNAIAYVNNQLKEREVSGFEIALEKGYDIVVTKNSEFIKSITTSKQIVNTLLIEEEEGRDAITALASLFGECVSEKTDRELAGVACRERLSNAIDILNLPVIVSYSYKSLIDTFRTKNEK